MTPAYKQSSRSENILVRIAKTKLIKKISHRIQRIYNCLRIAVQPPPPDRGRGKKEVLTEIGIIVGLFV